MSRLERFGFGATRAQCIMGLSLGFAVSTGAALGCSEAGPADSTDPVGGGGDSGAPEAGSGGASPGTGGQTSGTGGSASAEGGSVGVQIDPGTEGDGMFDQPAPYVAPPEALSLINGAPEGMLTNSAFFDSTSVYPTLTFEYWIYVPAAYEPGKPAALMVFQDGSHYTGATEAAFNTKTVFDNLIHEGAMPPTIGLFINPGSEDSSGVFQYPAEADIRNVQYTTPNAKFSQFLIEEAIPALVQSQFDIVDDPEGWAISGHSSGAIAALMVAWYNPGKFRKVLGHNTSFPRTEGVFPQIIADTDPLLPLRISMIASSNDIGGEAAGQWFDTNNQAAAILDEKGYHYRYLSGTGEHFPPVQSEADYPNALRWLWRGYSLPWYQ